MSEVMGVPTEERISGYIDREKVRDWTAPCEELKKLRAMLDAEGFEWEDRFANLRGRNKYVWETVSKKQVIVKRLDGTQYIDRAFRVMWGEFSYGGSDGLLEASAFDHSPIGNLTSNGAFEVCRLAMERASDIPEEEPDER